MQDGDWQRAGTKRRGSIRELDTARSAGGLVRLLKYDKM